MYGTITHINRDIGSAHRHLLRIQVGAVAPKDTVDELIVRTMVFAIDSTRLVVGVVIHHRAVEQLARHGGMSDIHATAIGLVSQDTIVGDETVVDGGVLAVDAATTAFQITVGRVVTKVAMQLAVGQR